MNINKNYFFSFLFFLTIVFFSSSFSQSVNGILLDTVKAGKFDTGKMWTFDNPPVDYFAQTYGFRPTQDWLNKVRLSSLRFATYCSASFVSEDGLVMTNHHCGRDAVTQVTKQGEDLHVSGFFAEKLEDERPVPDLFVEQLIEIKDITKEMQSAIETGQTDAEKIEKKLSKIEEIEKKYNNTLENIRAQVVTFYNGGQYSLYLYKKYTDVRLVFAPEDDLGFFGGDPDNFTYPRYDLDVTFFRVYDDNKKPLKTDNYFKWSKNGAIIGEPIFVVGNPGRTNRLNTVAHLEYDRDYNYPVVIEYLNMMVNYYTDLLNKYPERKTEYTNELFSYSNSQKVYNGIIKGLNDQYLMTKKKDFEKKFKDAVNSKPELSSKYGNPWNEISRSINELKRIFNELIAYSFNRRWSSVYFQMAYNFVECASNEIKVPDTLINQLYDEIDVNLNKAKIEFELNLITKYIGTKNDNVNELLSGKSPKDASSILLAKTIFTDKAKVLALSKKDAKTILNYNDPLIQFINKSYDRMQYLYETRDNIVNNIEINREMLGRALYEVYGNSIPPDATFTLRISDGMISSYDYNGTVAPPRTTFYGLYDRYYSFGRQYPWSLPKRWQEIPAEFDLETPFNFISTNDIVGGNSGSPVINQNAEIVGLAFDGNIESLPGSFIFTTEANRMVSVASEGLYEVIKDLYKAERLADELHNGKLKSQD